MLVEEAASFREAMAKFRSLGGTFAAAVVDRGLPDGRGDDLIIEMRALRPDMPVILATGLADEDVRERFAGESGVQILMKPFEPQRLLNGLRKFGIRLSKGR